MFGTPATISSRAGKLSEGSPFAGLLDHAVNTRLWLNVGARWCRPAPGEPLSGAFRPTGAHRRALRSGSEMHVLLNYLPAEID